MKNTIVKNSTQAAVFYRDIAQLLKRIPSFWKNVSAIFNRSILLKLSVSPSTILSTFVYLQDIDGSPRLLLPIDLPQYL